MKRRWPYDSGMHKIAAWGLALAFALTTVGSRAETLEGHVLGVTDGATITVLNARHQHLRVRIAGIDAPDRGQPFFKRSQDNLTKLVRRREVIVEWHKKDRYGRLVGTVFIKKGPDVGLEQVRAGLAWWNRDDALEQLRSAREAYSAAEKTARELQLGLWADPKPVPPWEWRNERFPAP